MDLSLAVHTTRAMAELQRHTGILLMAYIWVLRQTVGLRKTKRTTKTYVKSYWIIFLSITKNGSLSKSWKKTTNMSEVWTPSSNPEPKKSNAKLQKYLERTNRKKESRCDQKMWLILDSIETAEFTTPPVVKAFLRKKYELSSQKWASIWLVGHSSELIYKLWLRQHLTRRSKVLGSPSLFNN